MANDFSGETQANADQIIQGQSDWDLNQRGREQAAAAGRALAHVPFDAVLSSDLARPVQTAEGIIQENRQRWRTCGCTLKLRLLPLMLCLDPLGSHLTLTA